MKGGPAPEYQSQDDLKRKLSMISFDDDPINHLKLKIQDLKKERSNHHMQKPSLDCEHETRDILDSTYKKKRYPRNEQEDNKCR